MDLISILIGIGIGSIATFIGVGLKIIYVKRVQPYSELFNMAKSLIDNVEIKKIMELPIEENDKKE